MNLIDHLPAPLHNRATQEHLIYALFAASNTAPEHLQALHDGLCQLSPLPAQVHVYCQGQPPAQWHGKAYTLHSLNDPASAAALAQAEAALLPYALW